MQYFVRIRQNVGYLDGEDGAGVEDGVGSLARADLEADGGGEEVGRLLEHLRELPPVGGKEVPVGNSVPWRGAREREQDRRDAAAARGPAVSRGTAWIVWWYDAEAVRRHGAGDDARSTAAPAAAAALPRRNCAILRFWVLVVLGFGWSLEGLAMAIDGFGLLKLLGRGSHFVIERLQTSGGPLLTADVGEEVYLRLKWSRLSILNYTN